ncbi:hypothetical protein [Rhodoferax antarcticus]|uniref:hypothetical protein n=1 Tax=Rhodoferax antarcticus TaxID=81479 RepID=UPI0011150EF9|nr:hypothetical protein [Rhodoferax antarcticus]
MQHRKIILARHAATYRPRWHACAGQEPTLKTVAQHRRFKGAKAHFGCNTTRPGGASWLATSTNPNDLIFATVVGNRQTRRLARKTLAKMLKNALDSIPLSR